MSNKRGLENGNASHRKHKMNHQWTSNCRREGCPEYADVFLDLWNEYEKEVRHVVSLYSTEFNKGNPDVHLNCEHFWDWFLRKPR